MGGGQCKRGDADGPPLAPRGGVVQMDLQQQADDHERGGAVEEGAPTAKKDDHRNQTRGNEGRQEGRERKVSATSKSDRGESDQCE